MDMLIFLTASIVGLALVGLASMQWGVDSHDPIPDDHRR
jgi:hypothetical protein